MRKFSRLIRFPSGRRKRALIRMAGRALADDKGGETLEYVLVIGLIVAGVISTITCVGYKVVNYWNSISRSVPS